MQILHNIKNNKVFVYIFSRYFTYGIQFVNAIFIAIQLGPKYLGIWGFLNLVIMYFSQLHFGLPSSLNIIASKEKHDQEYVIKVFGNTLFLSLVIILISILLLVFMKISDIQFGVKYSFYNYIIPVIIIIACNFIIPSFSNMLRIFGNVKEISISQSIMPLNMLIVSFFFRGENLLWALLWSNVLALVVTIFIFIKATPFKINLNKEGNLSKFILSKGLLLFVYTSSFYFIIYSTRSIISQFYSVVEFGYFTFAFTLGNTVNMLFSSFSFLIFPKLLNRMSKLTNNEIIVILNKMRLAYITPSHFLIHLVVFIFPVFLYFFNEYESSLQAFRLIALTVVLYTNSFGFQGLILAKGKEKLIATLSVIALVINIIIGYIIADVLKLNFSYVIIATAISYMVYIYILTFFGRKLLSQSTNLFAVFNDFLNVKLFLPFLVSFYFSLTSVPNWCFAIPLILFLILNFKSFKLIIKTFNEVLHNSKIIDI